MKKFLVALQFLTIIPITIKSELEDSDFGEALLYYPLVGLLIGLLLSALLLIVKDLNPLVRGVLIVFVSVFLTGGLHIDGLADTVDGLYGGRDKELTLEIMRDSRVGAMGAISIVLILILKFSLYASYPFERLWPILVVSSLFSRWGMVLACNLFPYARSEGRGRAFIGAAKRRDLYLGGIVTLSIFILLMRIKGVLIFLISMLSLLIYLHYVNKRIGGMTGDTIGATNELAEICCLLLALIF